MLERIAVGLMIGLFILLIENFQFSVIDLNRENMKQKKQLVQINDADMPTRQTGLYFLFFSLSVR